MNTQGDQPAEMPFLPDPRTQADLEKEFTTLRISQRQLQLIREAMRHYRETKCPLDGNGDWCSLLTWRENIHTGAIELCCLGNCEEWAGELDVLAENATPDEAR